MRVRFIENPLCNGQTWMTGLEEGTDPPDLFPIGPFLGDLLRQVGETDQIFLGGISQEGKRTYCKFFYGVSFGSLVEIHSVPHQSRPRRKSLQTSHVSVTGLKWLELLPSIFCRLIGTDNTPNPFLQTLMKLPGHPVRTGQARRGRSTDLSALSMSKGFPGTQWRTECEPMKFHFYCAPLTPPTCLPQAGKAGLAGDLPVRRSTPEATEEGQISKFSPGR